MTKWTKLTFCYVWQLLMSMIRSPGSNDISVCSAVWLSYATLPPLVLRSFPDCFCLVGLVSLFGFMQGSLWTVASETPFCPSEFCILAGMLLHLDHSLLFTNEGRARETKDCLSQGWHVSFYHNTLPPPTVLLSSTCIPFLHHFPHSFSSQNPSYVQPTVYSQIYGLLFFN